MKTLTKMIAMVAAMGAMHTARAEGDEKEFVPGGEIEQISIVNGQLEVRANGAEIQGVKTPYVYVGTNTDHFAENAFARGGLTNLSQYVHMGNGQIYMTEKGNDTDVWTTEIKAAPAPLNGVTKVTKVGEGDNTSGASAMTEDMKAMLAQIKENKKNASLFKVIDGDLYCANSSGVYKFTPDENNGWSSKNTVAVGGKIKDFAIVHKNEDSVVCYTLVEKESEGKTYLYRNTKKLAEADSIAVDGDKVVATSGSTITTYDVMGNVKSSVDMGGNTTAPKKIKSSVVAGGIFYYATANTIGYERM